MEMHNLVITVISSISILLIISAATLLISKYTKIHFTILLIIVGYLFSNFAKIGPDFLHPLGNYKIDPDLILFACLPTLIFQSAYTMDTRLLYRNLVPVLMLAIPGLFLSTAIIGLIVWFFTPFNFLIALLLGAILSATDPVAVISLFKQLGVPKRLTILVEGESLFNDSTAIVTTKTILFIMTVGVITSNTIWYGMYDFCWQFFGGIFVGIIMTLITGYILSFTEEEPLIGISLILILAYLSFVIADKIFHVSGIMATITCGIFMAGWGRTKLSSITDESLRDLLEFLAYIANALVFLLVGFTINLSALINASYLIFIVIIAMLVSRAMVIYGLIPIISRFTKAEKIDFSYQTILWWGGLRGVIALAIVLGLTMPGHELLETVVIGAVLFTILAQGLSINKIIQWFKLDKPLVIDRFNQLEAELFAEKLTLNRMSELKTGGLFSEAIARNLQQSCKESAQIIRDELHSLINLEMTISEEKKLLFLQCFAEEKALFYEMYSNGHLGKNSYRVLNQEIDLEMDLIRDHMIVAEKIPTIITKKTSSWVINIFNYIPGLNTIAERLRISQTIRDYEEIWGLYQGSVTVLNHLDEIKKIGLIEVSVIEDVYQQFHSWLLITKKYLNEIAEQFPEFVNDMQRRFGERLLLQAKCETMTEEIKQGLVPLGIGEEIIKKYEQRIQQLRIRKKYSDKLTLDSHELLLKNPFFKFIPPDEIERALALLKVHHAPAGEIIIRQGAYDNSLYMIMRGVVCVIKETQGESIEVATLLAGDFFGEQGLLYGVQRTATCKAISPCILYILNHNNFELLKKRYPAIKSIVLEKAIKRSEL